MWQMLLPLITSLLQKKQGGQSGAPAQQLPGAQPQGGPPGAAPPGVNPNPPSPLLTQQSQAQYDPSKMEALKGSNPWMDQATSASGF